MINWHNLQKY